MDLSVLREKNIQEKEFELYSEPYATSLGLGLSLRVYPDSRPHNLKIATLQKGLILVLDGQELIEEGSGFGVPVAVFPDRTYFSSIAQVFIRELGDEKIIVKRFIMDVYSKRDWKINDIINNPFYKSVSSFFEETYRRYPNTRRIIFSLMKMKNKVGVKTDFIKSTPRGEVTIKFKIRQNFIDVEANLTKLDKTGLKRLVILNEQGSTFFRRLIDSNGTNLIDGRIGAWDIVIADLACFSDYDNTLDFCLRRLPKSRLFTGREYLKESLAWAGMEYEVEPNLDKYSYRIQIHQKKKKDI
ncbi:MAG: hypothetical protein QG670_349 [Thermoproteota archaeon]|nr:hypothetical protein [Thermoproteota archaeon]